MTVRIKHPALQLDMGITSQLVKFYPAGTGAPTSVTGKGCTVARSTTGTYTLTFADNDGLTFVGARADYNADNQATDTNEATTGEYASNVLTVHTRNKTSGAAADIAADADRFVLVEILWAVNTTANGDGV
jgi:hypothetical protein